MKQKVGVGKISSFVNQVVEKGLPELAQEEKRLRQQLITAQKRVAKSQKLKKELVIWDKTVDDYINKDNRKN